MSREFPNPPRTPELSDDEEINIATLERLNPDFNRFRRISIHPCVLTKLNAVYPKDTIFIPFLGSSAVGKDSMLERLLQNSYSLVHTYTTRKARDTKNPERHKFVDKVEFSHLINQNAFIEWLPQLGEYYGTSIEQMEIALRENSTTIWRGEEKGLPLIQKWISLNHPDIARYVVVVLPQMTLGDYKERIASIRPQNEVAGRTQTAMREMVNYGSIADFIIMNPPENDGPLQAVDAMNKLLKFLKT